MTKLGAYLNDPAVKPRTQTCRIKVWAHDNALTVMWLTAMNLVGWVVTVITCG